MPGPTPSSNAPAIGRTRGRVRSRKLPARPGSCWRQLCAGSSGLPARRLDYPLLGRAPRTIQPHGSEVHDRADPGLGRRLVPRTGDWPYANSGEIPGSAGVNWRIVENAIRIGRGAPGRFFPSPFVGQPRRSDSSGASHRGKDPRLGRCTSSPTGRWPARSSGPCLGGVRASIGSSLIPAIKEGTPPPAGPARRSPSY